MRNLYFVFTIIATLGFVTPELSAQRGRFRSEQSGQDQGERLNRMFTMLDKNSDGAISADEAPERMKSRLAQMDTNKNGNIEMSELKTAMSARRGQSNNGQAALGKSQKKMQGKGKRGQIQQSGNDMAEMMFGRFDKDGNGSISKAEAPDRMKQGFDRLDSNGDGKIDKKEFAVVVERMQQSQGQAGNGQKMMQGQGKRGPAQQGGSDMAEMMFGRFDEDGNGSISKEEAPDRMKQGFDRLDSNGDGKIDKKEFAVVVERMQQSQGTGKGSMAGQNGAGNRITGGSELKKPNRPKFN